MTGGGRYRSSEKVQDPSVYPARSTMSNCPASGLRSRQSSQPLLRISGLPISQSRPVPAQCTLDFKSPRHRTLDRPAAALGLGACFLLKAAHGSRGAWPDVCRFCIFLNCSLSSNSIRPYFRFRYSALITARVARPRSRLENLQQQTVTGSKS